jgi:PTS system mannose-specific IIB component/fructoselysine and glucoselysine-specific PTS system IIB component
VSIVLYRVDERLIHGQVVLGWGSQLIPTRYVVVDDELSESEWEQDLYQLGAGDAEAIFVSVSQCRKLLAGWQSDPVRSILLTRDLSSMLALAEGGLMSEEKVNLGGLHHGPGREQVLTYLHLTQEDRQTLRELGEEVASVSARDLPDATKVSLKALVGS